MAVTPLEGTMLAAAVTQAVAAIPPAVQSLRELLSSKKPDAQKAIGELDQLANHIAALADISAWLIEAKQLHDRLQGLDTQVQEIRAIYQNAVKQTGVFNFQDYDVRSARQRWDAVREHTLSQLLAFAEGVERIEKEPLVRTSGNKFVSGPQWCQQLLAQRNAIDSLLKQYDSGPKSETIVNLADTMNAFISHTRQLVHTADDRIRAEATSMGQLLAQLSGTVGAG